MKALLSVNLKGMRRTYSFSKMYWRPRCWWLTLVILGIQEAEIRSVVV
jgi:hypothetical protein